MIECFLDTNILIYAAMGHGAEEPKRARASDLLEGAEFGISAQVLQEFYAAATRSSHQRPLTPERAWGWVERFARFPCAAIDTNLVKIGIGISNRYKLSYWDGAIIAAAELLGAPVLYTEDLNHGQAYGSVRVVNPFL